MPLNCTLKNGYDGVFYVMYKFDTYSFFLKNQEPKEKTFMRLIWLKASTVLRLRNPGSQKG